MAKKQKSVIKYGIEITKPHSQEMYAHNEKVAEEMKHNIIDSWRALLKKQMVHDEESLMESDWEYLSDDSDLVKLQKLVCYSGYGSGYTIGNVNEEFLKELDMMANWQLHQEYGYGVQLGLVPKVKCSMLGHGDDESYYVAKFDAIGYELLTPKK